MLRALAVDDEKPLLEELLYLLRSDPRVHSAEGASDATEALRRVTRALESGPDGPDRIDVVFLDIHMAGLTGLDIARLLAGFARPPLIVFVTAHEGFAVQAFDLKAVDYVLKPVRPERLAEAVRRACAQLGGPAGAQPAAASGPPVRSRAPAAAGARPAPQPPLPPHRPGPEVTVADRAADQIAVELGGVTRFVAIADIAYVEAQGDYARLHTDGGSHLVRIPLSTLEQRWAARGFVRIHRRHLVALGRIDELRLDAGTTSVRVGAAELQVSRRHARELRDLLMRHATG
ncbi:LytR/AlgR family response regulator transcription factor [Streptomyces goshikiensis]|uniref:LytR/AlgR family response regulator transcription factor n=1 Tax=Streptomyces goshikiensis TaxID=1942 RepID=UPI0037AC7F16